MAERHVTRAERCQLWFVRGVAALSKTCGLTAALMILASVLFYAPYPLVLLFFFARRRAREAMTT